MDDPIYQEFFDYCKFQRGLSENTIRSYFADLTTYNNYLSEKNLSFRNIKTRDLDAFIKYLGDERKNKRATVVHKVATLRAFYKYLYRIDEIEVDIMKKIVAPRMEKRLAKFLKPEQQNRLIEYFENKKARFPESKWTNRRDKAIAILLLESGLRVSELCNLKIKDLNFEQKIAFIKGKGGKEAEIFLSDKVIGTLEDYIENTRTHLMEYFRKKPNNKKRFLKDNGYLFIQVRNGLSNLSTRHVFAILHRAGRVLGFRIHPHILRHTFATNLRRKGADLILIQEALRHSSIITTSIYAHIASVQFKNEMGKYLDNAVPANDKIVSLKPKLTLIKNQ